MTTEMQYAETHSAIGTSAATTASDRTNALAAGLFAAVLGAGLVFVTGFSHSATIHNAAHDTRHALSFPCH